MSKIKILTIGNSLADNATRFLKPMFAETNTQIVVAKANIGGCSLEKHWNLVEQCDLLPEVKPYPFHYLEEEKVYLGLKDALRVAPWDFITLQQVTNLTFVKESYQPWFDKLVNLITTTIPEAKIVIHQTWSYAKGSPLLKSLGMTPLDMYEGLKECYSFLSKEYGFPLIPCGDAFERARDLIKYEPSAFTPEKVSPLELPDQSRSLITEYYWKTGNTASGKAELHYDERHANVNGCYLAGAVWYQFFSGKKIVDNQFVPEGLNTEILPLLKQAVIQQLG